MNVFHFNTFPYGGAAAAARRIHERLLQNGVRSQFLFDRNDRHVRFENANPVPWLPQIESNGFGRLWEKRRLKRLHRQYDTHLATRDSNQELFSMCETTEQRALDPRPFTDSVVHLHWLAFLADYPAFFGSLPKGTPVVWTLHDMNPMTGGCHYSSGCGRFVNGCGHCPQLIAPAKNDLSRKSFRIKQQALRNINLTVTAPSQWILDLARRSPIFPGHTQFELIRLGFDLSTLTPIETRLARRHLSAETEKTVIGFGAESISNHRKGFDLLLAALTKLRGKENVECFVFGSGDFEFDNLDLPIRHLGFIDSESRLAQFYSACDVVVVPSREDNQPQVGLEAMACGTPVIGFDTGGIGEYVRPGMTGWLAEPENADDLARQIDDAVAQTDLRKDRSLNCRKLMESDFEIGKQTEMYWRLYQRLHTRRAAA